MKISLLGIHSGCADEGMKVVTLHLRQELSKHQDVLPLYQRGVLSHEALCKLRDFDPHIIHSVHGPTIRTFILMKILKGTCGKAKTVISALQPHVSGISKALVKILKPDLILAQSYESEDFFVRLGCIVDFLPNGVDVQKFSPVSEETKKEFRDKYGIDKDKFIILHVGPIRRNRNLRILAAMQEQIGGQVIVVGSTSLAPDAETVANLKKSGCIVWQKYLPNIEEIYAMSDCYVFPTVDKNGSIELPLTVMEAMACNLPVISTEFRALPRLFSEGNGLFFVRKENNVIEKLRQARKEAEVKTREKVLPYSWGEVAKKLEEIYGRIIEDGKRDL